MIDRLMGSPIPVPLSFVVKNALKIVSKFGADGDRVAVRLAAQQDNHFSNDFIYINQLPLQSALLEQRADSANDISRARYVFNESRCSFACLCHIGLIAT